MKKIISISLLALTVSACAGTPRPSFRDSVIDRALAGAPGQAQPSKVVAREIAFARAAREDGQWTAFRAFAAPGALLHGGSGIIAAEPWLAAQANPASSVQWEPRTIWMSCDGKLAVSMGRFKDPDGKVGNFITVWKQQDNGEYLWAYDVGAADDPQPPPPRSFEDGDIVVSGLDAINAQVADCPHRGQEIPTAPPVSLSDEFESGGGISPDGTLQWRWEHHPDGNRKVIVNYFHKGNWQVALDEALASPKR